MNAYRGPPATLGSSAAAGVRFVVWCAACGHRVEPDPAEMGARYCADTTLPDWQARLVCGACGAHQVEMVITGTATSK